MKDNNRLEVLPSSGDLGAWRRTAELWDMLLGVNAQAGVTDAAEFSVATGVHAQPSYDFGDKEFEDREDPEGFGDEDKLSTTFTIDQADVGRVLQQARIVSYRVGNSLLELVLLSRQLVQTETGEREVYVTRIVGSELAAEPDHQVATELHRLQAWIATATEANTGSYAINLEFDVETGKPRLRIVTDMAES